MDREDLKEIMMVKEEIKKAETEIEEEMRVVETRNI